MSERKRDLLVLLVLLLIPAVLFSDVLFGASGFFSRDLTTFYFPTRLTMRDAILSGAFPYWNPRVAGGQPMAANPDYAVFYPPTWLVLLPSAALGFQWGALLHIFIALAGMFLFLRSLQLTRAASAIGAISFAMGAFFLSYINLLPILFGLSWLPLILLFVRRAVLRPNVRDIAAAALVWGLQLLAGEPTTILQTGFIVLTGVAYLSWQERRLPLSEMKVLAAIVIGATAVGSIVLVPAFDHALASVRRAGFSEVISGGWSMPPVRPLELFFPSIFGDPLGIYWGDVLYGGRGSGGFLAGMYLGLPIVICAIAGMILRLRGSGLTVSLVGFSWLLAIGDHTPLFTVLYRAGVFRSIRFPEKFILISLLAVLIFGSVVLDRLIRGDERIARAASAVAAVIAAIALILAVASRTSWYVANFASLWGPYAPEVRLELADLSAAGWARDAVRAVLAALLIVTLARRGYSRAWILLTCAIAVADLTTVTTPLVPRLPAEFFEEPASARRLPPEHDRYRVFHEIHFVEKAFGIRPPMPRGNGRYWFLRESLYPLIGTAWGLQMTLEGDPDATALTSSTDFYHSMYFVSAALGRVHEAFLSMANVGFVVRPQDHRLNPNGVSPVRFDPEPPHPRHWFAKRIVPLHSVDEFVERIRGGQWSPGDAFVQGIDAFTPAPGRVLGVSESFNAIRIDFETEGRGFLVIGTTPHKYWRATLDGAVSELLQTNLGFQGMVVPAGRHRVELRYRNTLILATAPVSLLSALLLLGLLFRRPGARTE